MAITEDGTGLVDADSYVSVSEADSFFSTRNETSWFGGGKEASLLIASEYIDITYSFLGNKLNPNQGLEFPRDILGFPNAIKKAVMFIALKDLNNENLFLDNNLIKKTKVDVLETEYFKPQDSTFLKTFKYVDSLLAPYIVNVKKSQSPVELY